LNICDYIINKGRIVNEDDKTETYTLKWNDEFICRRRMKSGDPRGYNGRSDEDDYGPEEGGRAR
jgi:hypothetical protein